MRDWKDRLGIFASVACAIHCAATPVLVATLPTLKLTEWMIAPEFHQIVALACSALVAAAIVPAFLRFRDYRILSLSAAGLGLILSAAFLLPSHCCSSSIAMHDPEVVGMKVSCSDGACEEQTPSPTTGTDPKHDHSHAGHDHAHHDHAGHDHAAGHEHAGHDHADAGTSIHQGESDASSVLMAGMGWVQPWMTPLGGLLLILAHAMNLRRRLGFGCSRACCHDEVDDASLLPMPADGIEGIQTLARAS
jgi:hypothetical protein